MSADMFLDASFAIALSSPPDANHDIAKPGRARCAFQKLSVYR